jgi:adenosine kinase
VPGGAAQNTARVAQWVFKDPATAMLGSVGDDVTGTKLAQ